MNTKILLITSIPINLSEIKGGVDSAVINLLSGLVKTNTKVRVVSVIPDIKNSCKIKYANNIIIYYFPYTFPKIKLYQFLFHRKNIINIQVDQFQPDIISYQCIDPGLLSISKKHYKKLVVTQHGIISEERKYQIGIKKNILFLVKTFFENYFTKRIRNIIFISDYNKNLFDSIKIKNKRFCLIRNAVNEEFFKVPLKNTTNNRLFYLATIAKRKNLILLLKVLQKLKNQNYNYTLDIIGPFTCKKYKKEINNFVLENNLDKIVYFHGIQNQTSVIKLISNYDIFVLPSLQETLPVSIAEAMAAGKIVVASNVGGVKEMFDDGVSGFLFEPQETQLEKLLKKLYNTPNYRQITFNAKEKAVKLFHPKTIANKTVYFFNKLLNN